MLLELFKSTYEKIHEKIYSYRTVRLEPSDWVEANIYMTSAETLYPGLFKYERSPYTREVIDCLSANSPVEMVAIMKCSQSGFTSGVIVPGICYTISECPSNIMFLSGTRETIKDTIQGKLDPIIRNSGLSHLIQSSDTRKRNQRTGDTDFKKEFAGGSLIAGSYTPSKLRMHSIKNMFADEYDDAPRYDKKEGSIRGLIEGRTKSFGSRKKIVYCSTPTIQGQSNIEDAFLDGDQRKWSWECTNCKEYIPIEWRVDREDGTYGGIKWTLDDNNELIPSSVHYECQKCKGKILEKDKYSLNISGKWIPTAKPKEPNFRSYQLNAITIPPGYDDWVKLVRQFLKACPPDDVISEGDLKTFVNTQLGQTWEERGTTPKVTELMKNMTSDYVIGIIPDKAIEEHGNGKIALLSLSCDLGGVMEKDNEDVRLDWELVAHTTTGVTYNIEHGSIGTFKRSRKKSKKELENDSDRVKWTYSHGMPNSVWIELIKIIETTYLGQSGNGYDIDITLIDSSHFTKLTYDFIREYNHPFVLSIKGYEDGEYRKLSKDTPVVKRSLEQLGKLYILQVNQLKDMLSANMKLNMGIDGFQPVGYMNYPQSENGKYTMNSYFHHFEAEHRVEESKGGVVVGYAWKKKNSSVENHFFDVAVYNTAAPYIYIDILRRSETGYNNLTWDDFLMALSE